MKKILQLAVISFVAQLHGQELLPNGLSETEQQLISGYQFRSTQPTPPPTTSVRTAAEWEEVEYLVITWVPQYQNILRQIVAVGVQECKVIITTPNQATVSSYLTSNGISLSNIIFLNTPYDSIWMRDYAGNTVYSNTVGDRALVDWIYNRPRPNDNNMPSAHATLTATPIYITNSGTNDLVNTGGNFMSDGLGNAFASELILEENAAGNPYSVSAKSEAQIDQIMLDYMGINNYIKMPVLPYDGIHHIDMHMKLLDEQTLLVARYPDGVADGPQINANINSVVSTYTSPFGTPYKVFRIDSPPSTGGLYPNNGGAYRTYTNSVFINKSVLVPIYRPEVDGPALQLYQQLLPGYNIVGIDVDNSGENLISLSGAIHCITHTIGVNNPLLIVHQPVEEAPANASATITASIQHNSGIAAATVFYRLEGQNTWQQAPMSAIGNNDWSASIMMPANATPVQYYIWAQANSGKELTRPLPAPAAYWTIIPATLFASEWAEKHITGPFPNPASESTSFHFNEIKGAVNITITDLLGRTLYATEVQNGEGQFLLALNSAWQGTLFVSFKGQFGSITRKLLKR